MWAGYYGIAEILPVCLFRPNRMRPRVVRVLVRCEGHCKSIVRASQRLIRRQKDAVISEAVAILGRAVRFPDDRVSSVHSHNLNLQHFTHPRCVAPQGHASGQQFYLNPLVLEPLSLIFLPQQGPYILALGGLFGSQPTQLYLTEQTSPSSL